jgi:hypothetical protein
MMKNSNEQTVDGEILDLISQVFLQQDNGFFVRGLSRYMLYGKRDPAEIKETENMESCT